MYIITTPVNLPQLPTAVCPLGRGLSKAIASSEIYTKYSNILFLGMRNYSLRKESNFWVLLRLSNTTVCTGSKLNKSISQPPPEGAKRRRRLGEV